MEKIIRNYFLLFFLSIVWGSSFILMKKGLESFSYTQVAALRIFIAFISLVPFIYQSVTSVKKNHIIPIIIVGLFGNGLPAFLFAKAQTLLESSVVGILNSLVPLFTLLLGAYFFGNQIKKLNLYGIILGLLGAVFLIYFTNHPFMIINSYVFFVIVATIMYAVSVNVIDKYLYSLNPLHITSLAFLIISPMSFLYIDINDLLLISSTKTGLESLLYIVILAVLGTSLAVVIFNQLVIDSTALFASSVTYLIPIVAIFWGVFDGEIITFIHLLSIFLILSGIYLVNKK